MGGRSLAVVAALSLVAASCSESDTDEQTVTGTPTFNKHIAPILFAHCATCHRPGESAPFSLLTFADARKKRRQIVKVTGRRIMPPWLPARGHESFVGERRLTDGEIRTLSRWAQGGTPEGVPGDLPPLPKFPKGWQLREPDLVVTLPEVFTVPADGPDIFRNFVLPVPGDRLRYVEAVEIRPGNPAAHHAILQVDRTRQSRQLDGQEPGLGFAGMSMGFSSPPDGHFIAWTPGKIPSVAPKDMAWRLHPGSDLVLQVHLTPTGKVESVRPRIGLFFRDVPPTRFPYSIVLFSEKIDIPAKESAYIVRDEYALPVQVELVSVYPHAHYVCRKMHGYARLPGGKIRTLIKIDDWDFDWQDAYRFAGRIVLPAGTTLHMEYVYDNSAGNPSNPNDPPERVQFGQGSEDEMGTMTITVIPKTASDRLALREQSWRSAIAKKSGDWDAHLKLAVVLRERGQVRDAVESLQTALSLRRRYPDALCELGYCLELANRFDEALRLYDEALKIDADDHVARLSKGRALMAKGDLRGAEPQLQRALARFPDLVDARVLLGNLLARRGETGAAIRHFRRALAARPGIPEVHNNLATALFAERRLEDAEREYRAALALRSEYFNARFNLGRVLAARGRKQEALGELRKAARMRPDHPALKAELQRLQK
jgi:tetratricopeptide (TPR) repeat protein